MRVALLVRLAALAVAALLGATLARAAATETVTGSGSAKADIGSPGCELAVTTPAKHDVYRRFFHASRAGTLLVCPFEPGQLATVFAANCTALHVSGAHVVSSSIIPQPEAWRRFVACSPTFGGRNWRAPRPKSVETYILAGPQPAASDLSSAIAFNKEDMRLRGYLARSGLPVTFYSQTDDIACFEIDAKSQIDGGDYLRRLGYVPQAGARLEKAKAPCRAAVRERYGVELATPLPPPS